MTRFGVFCALDQKGSKTRDSNSKARQRNIAGPLFTRIKLLLHIILLFTLSDFKTIVAPSTVFGITNALAFRILDSNQPSPEKLALGLAVAKRTPLVIFWIWINLLPFNISNQRQPDAIKEDKLNKPWRPLPKGHITISSAKKLMIACYAVAIAVSYWLGPLAQCLSLIYLGYFYNDLGGGDRSWIVRNLINALGYTCFISGAVKVALGKHDHVAYSVAFETWYALIASIIFTTIQIQDMHDQEGDAAIGRKTLPLVIGDAAARWSIAVSVLFWSVMASYFWDSSLVSGLICCVLGGLVVGRSLVLRTVQRDKDTFRLWNVWMLTIYSLPLARALVRG